QAITVQVHRIIALDLERSIALVLAQLAELGPAQRLVDRGLHLDVGEAQRLWIPELDRADRGHPRRCGDRRLPARAPRPLHDHRRRPLPPRDRQEPERPRLLPPRARPCARELPERADAASKAARLLAGRGLDERERAVVVERAGEREISAAALLIEIAAPER